MSVQMLQICAPVRTDGTAKQVLMALADYADDDGVCWPSAPTLGAYTCRDEGTVRRALKRLAKGHWIDLEERPGQQPIYRINVARMAPLDPDTPGGAPGHPGQSARGSDLPPRAERPDHPGQSARGGDLPPRAERPDHPGQSARAPRAERPGTPGRAPDDPSRSVKIRQEIPQQQQRAPEVQVPLLVQPDPARYREHPLDPERLEDHRAVCEAWDAALGGGMSPTSITRNDVLAIGALLADGHSRFVLVAICEDLQRQRDAGSYPRMTIQYLIDRARSERSKTLKQRSRSPAPQGVQARSLATWDVLEERRRDTERRTGVKVVGESFFATDKEAANG